MAEGLILSDEKAEPTPEVSGMLKEQLLAAYYTLRGLARNLEIILRLDAKTTNQSEARGLAYFRDNNINIMEIVKEHKSQLH